ncbi:FtsX-like permease family protein [Leucobacter weissii]|uniref:FtsX-like permease family protein n=1 Tax=Leucobacter weissii TaxID=1983706 RepID=A0A939MLA1_9MICO|nr:FtsX family ABC transporter permease [Leucobacter weissii]MBO1900516.1 FtsX-like permease family protein [Leucobacter weissii]
MLRVVLANIRAHRARLVAVSLAVLLAVAFMSATLILGSSMRATLQHSLGQDYAQADLVVVEDPEAQYTEEEIDSGAAPGAEDLEKLERAVSEVPGVAEVFVPRALDIAIGSGDVQQIFELRQLAPESFRDVTVTEGRLPEASDEVVMWDTVAEQFGLEPGAQLEITSYAGTADDSAQAEAKPATVVGVLETSRNPFAAGQPVIIGAPSGIEHFAAAPENVRMDYGTPAQILLDPSADPDAARAAIAEALPKLPGFHPTLQTPDDLLSERLEGYTGAADVLTLVMLAFVAIAMLVAALVIANTFAVIVAQRARELALLRCLGASSGQVRGSVLLEALVMAAVASVVGVLVAIGLMLGLVAIGNAGGLGGTLGVFGMDWTAVVIPILVGIVLTLVAALAPAREATRVSPLAAMRPLDAARASTRAGALRLVAGLVLFFGGFALLGVAAFLVGQAELALLVALGGSALSAVGAIMLAIFVVPRLIGWLGRLISARVPGRLAALNSVRNPRRTAATATALLIGVTLVATVYTGAEVARATFNQGLDEEYPVDVVVTLPALDESGEAVALDAAAFDRIAAIDGVEGLTPMRSAYFQEGDGRVWEAWAVDAREYDAVSRVAPVRLEGGAVTMADPPKNGEITLGGETMMDDASAEETTLRALRGGAPDSVLLVSPETLGQLPESQAGDGALLRLSDGLDFLQINEIRTQITELLPTSFVGGAALERAVFEQIITTLLLIVTGLLAVAIVIAVIGVGNTLSLSVIERTRENALLRALGLTRAQLRWTLANEAILLSVVAAVAGVVLGVAYGYLGARSVLNSVGEVSFAIPWAALGVVLVLAALAGLLASVLPARRAARLSPIAGLAVA